MLEMLCCMLMQHTEGQSPWMQVKWIPWRDSWLTCSDDDTIRLWDVEGCATMSIPYKGDLLPWPACGCRNLLKLQSASGPMPQIAREHLHGC